MSEESFTDKEFYSIVGYALYDLTIISLYRNWLSKQTEKIHISLIESRSKEFVSFYLNDHLVKKKHSSRVQECIYTILSSLIEMLSNPSADRLSVITRDKLIFDIDTSFKLDVYTFTIESLIRAFIETEKKGYFTINLDGCKLNILQKLECDLHDKYGIKKREISNIQKILRISDDGELLNDEE